MVSEHIGRGRDYGTLHHRKAICSMMHVPPRYLFSSKETLTWLRGAAGIGQEWTLAIIKYQSSIRHFSGHDELAQLDNPSWYI